jgi:large subunit ribosomal protein L34e
MTRKSANTRSRKNVIKRLPGGKSKIFITKKTPKRARCELTGEILHSTPRSKGSKDRTIPKSLRRPQRPYGGNLSSKALRNLLIEKARKND